MSYFARSSSSEMPSSSGSLTETLPAGAGSPSGAPSRPLPSAAARSRASGSAGLSPTAMLSRGPAPGACGTRPAFSSALRTASSSAALFSTSASASGSSSESSALASAAFSCAASCCGERSVGRVSCACRGAAAQSETSRMAKAERNQFLLTAAARAVKVHIGSGSGPFPDMGQALSRTRITRDRSFISLFSAHAPGPARARESWRVSATCSLQRGAFLRPRLLALCKRLAVAGADDERPVLRVVEVGRILRLVAADAEARRHLGADVAARVVLDVLAARAMAILALHVAAAHALAVDAGAAHLGAIDAAHAAGLLPSGYVAAHAVEAELLVDLHQRRIGAGMPGLRPERS